MPNLVLSTSLIKPNFQNFQNFQNQSLKCQGPVCRKSRDFSGPFRVTILLVSSKRRGLEALNLAVI